MLGFMVAAVVGLAAPASAQVDRHRGKVIIGSAANDAVSVPSGGVTAIRVETAGANPLVYTNETDGPTNEKKWRWLGFAGDLYLQAESDDALTVNTAVQITRAGATPSQVLMMTGTVSAPALSFQASATSGIYLSGSSDVNIANAGVRTLRTTLSGGAPLITAEGDAFGTGAVTGAVILAGQNTSGADAPGCIGTGLRGSGNVGVFWVDSTGVMRVTTGLGVSACPTESGGDTIGTVVGTQTSTRASKAIAGEVTNTAAAMAIIRATPVYQFTYKSGAYNGETFFGIVTDESPLFGMDRGKSFNPVTAFGATVLALRDLDARVAALEARR
jgi:hypothetical protein